jgi:hypothetical protein
MTSINNNIVNTTTTAASSVTAADVEKEEVNEGEATATAKTKITYSDFEDPPQGNDHNDDDDDDEEEENLEEMMMTATDNNNNNTRCMVFKCKEKAEYSFLGKRAKQKCFCRDHYLLISSIIKGKSSI